APHGGANHKNRRPLRLQNQTRRTLGWWSRWSVVWGLRLGCGDDGTWHGGGGGFGGDSDEVVRMARAVVVSWVAAAVAVSGCMFMAEIAKRLDENTNLIKDCEPPRISHLEIQVRQMSIILREKLSGNLQGSTVIKPRSNDETISTSVKADTPSIRRIDASQYAVSNLQNRNLFSESKKMTLPSRNRLNDDYWDKLKETNGEKDLEAHYTNAKPIGKALPRKEKDPEQATVKRPKGIAENVIVGIDKFTFPIDFIILDIPEDFKTPLILERPFLSTAHAIINMFKAKITLSVRNDKIFFKSNKPTSNIIKRVYALGLLESRKLGLETRLMGNELRKNKSQDPNFEDFIEPNDPNEPIEHRRNRVKIFIPIINEAEVSDAPDVVLDYLRLACEGPESLEVSCFLQDTCSGKLDRRTREACSLCLCEMVIKEEVINKVLETTIPALVELNMLQSVEVS
ncbi:reverse transcriptase domain-containing protein, partial [Tanacetum coccineum]